MSVQRQVKPRGLAANFSSLLTAQLWHRGCLGISAILVAHTFGRDGLGRLLAGISFVFMFWPLIDAGLAELFIRDVAGHREPLPAYARQVIRLKNWLTLVSFLAIWAVAEAYTPMRDDLSLIACLALVLIMESYTTLLRSIFRIQERMHKEAILLAIDGSLKLAVVWFVIWTPGFSDPLLAIAIGWLAAGLLSWGLAAWSVRAWWPWRQVTTSSGVGTWFALLQRSLPLVMVFSLSLMNLRVAIVFLGVLSGHADAGNFGAGERLLEAIQVLPLALAYVLLPVSARLANSMEELRTLTRRVLGWLIGGALIVAWGLVVWGGWLLRLVFGSAFQQAASLMGVLGWIAVPLFLKPVMEKILCGIHQQGMVWRAYLIVSFANALALSIVVPAAGLFGATSCVLVAELASATILAVGLWWSLRQEQVVHALPQGAGAFVQVETQ